MGYCWRSDICLLVSIRVKWYAEDAMITLKNGMCSTASWDHEPTASLGWLGDVMESTADFRVMLMGCYRWLLLPLILLALQMDFRSGVNCILMLCIGSRDTRMTIKGCPFCHGLVWAETPWDSWHVGKRIQTNLSKVTKIWGVENSLATGQKIQIWMMEVRN